MTVSQLGYNYKNLAANATTVIRTGPGVLRGVTINTIGASNNVMTIYDGVSAAGTVIATIDTTVAAGQLLYDVCFSTGLTVVIGTGTAADVTVAWTAL